MSAPPSSGYVAANNPLIAGEFDESLESLLESIKGDDPVLFKDVRLDALLASLVGDVPVAGACDPDEAPPLPVTPKTRRGDLYVLGDHRLLCGDCTIEADVKRLLNGERVDIVSDPPYGISVNTSWLSAMNVNRGKPACKNDDQLIGDDGSLDLSWIYKYQKWFEIWRLCNASCCTSIISSIHY